MRSTCKECGERLAARAARQPAAKPRGARGTPHLHCSAAKQALQQSSGLSFTAAELMAGPSNQVCAITTHSAAARSAGPGRGCFGRRGRAARRLGARRAQPAAARPWPRRAATALTLVHQVHFHHARAGVGTALAAAARRLLLQAAQHEPWHPAAPCLQRAPAPTCRPRPAHLEQEALRLASRRCRRAEAPQHQQGHRCRCAQAHRRAAACGAGKAGSWRRQRAANAKRQVDVMAMRCPAPSAVSPACLSAEQPSPVSAAPCSPRRSSASRILRPQRPLSHDALPPCAPCRDTCQQRETSRAGAGRAGVCAVGFGTPASPPRSVALPDWKQVLGQCARFGTMGGVLESQCAGRSAICGHAREPPAIPTETFSTELSWNKTKQEVEACRKQWRQLPRRRGLSAAALASTIALQA